MNKIITKPRKLDYRPRSVIININTNKPPIARLQILVSNNALDKKPNWEYVTSVYNQRITYNFANQFNNNGWALATKIIVDDIDIQNGFEVNFVTVGVKEYANLSETPK